MKQRLHSSQEKQTCNTQEGTELVGTLHLFHLFHFFFFHSLSLSASLARLPPPDLVIFCIIMTPGLAVWTASGRARPDNSTEHNTGESVKVKYSSK